MNFEQMLTSIIIFLYFLGTLGSTLGAFSMRPPVRRAGNWLTLAGFAANTLLVITALVQYSFAELSANYYLLLLSWSVLLLYLCAWNWFKSSFLTLTAAPLGLILSVLSTQVVGTQTVLPPNFATLFFWLHISSLFVCLALLALAFGTGILFLLMERKLKGKAKLSKFLKEQPALTSFDKINTAAIIAGFPLYTLGILSGYVWSMGAQPLETVKGTISFIIWGLFAFLFYQRLGRGLRGRKVVLLTIVVFLVWVFSLIIELGFTTHHSKILLP